MLVEVPLHNWANGTFNFISHETDVKLKLYLSDAERTLIVFVQSNTKTTVPHTLMLYAHGKL